MRIGSLGLVASFGLVLLALTSACSGEPPERGARAPAEDPSSPGGAVGTGAAPEGGNSAVLSSRAPAAKQYAVAVDVPKDVSVGADATVAVRVTPSGSWHLNEDYNTSLEVVAPEGVTLSHDAQLGKDEARVIEQDSIAFDVKFVADAAGAQAFTGKLKFAVCEEDVCQPVSADIEFAVAVE